MHEIQKPITKQPPYSLAMDDISTILNIDPESSTLIYKNASSKDQAFHMCKQSLDRTKDNRTNWKHFNKLFRINGDELATSVGLVPIFDAEPDNHDIYMCGENEIHCISPQ